MTWPAISNQKRSYAPDPKPPRRKKNAKVMKALHLKGVICVLCGEPGTLHHVLPRSQGGDDIEANLLGLCGDGVAGCHGLIEANDEKTRIDLGLYIMLDRLDTYDYILEKLGREQGLSWLQRRLFIV